MSNSLKFIQPNGVASSIDFRNRRFMLQSPIRTYDAIIPSQSTIKLKGDKDLYEIVLHEDAFIEAPDIRIPFDTFQIILTQDSTGSYNTTFSDEFLFPNGSYSISSQKNVSSIISCVVTNNLNVLAKINTGFSEIEEMPSEFIPIDFELMSRGNGTLVSTLNIFSAQDFELSINGEGSFYDDYDQTIPLGNSYIVTLRYKSIYIKLTSGIATLTISNSETITGLGSDSKSFWSFSINSPGINISNIGQLINLTYIYSLGTGIIGDITELFESPNIEYIDFCGGGTTGNITNIDRAINLKSLSLSSSLNQYSGSITNIQYLYELETLSISSSYLTGNINGFGSLTKLKEITLTCPLVSGIISNLNSLILLEKLYLSSNLFTGTISSISDLVNLNSLTLVSNDISGSVTNLYSFPLLNTIFILSNTFTGELHSLDQLTRLRKIRIISDSASITFNSDDAWAVDSNNFIVYVNISGLTTGQVDNFIIAFSKINSFVSGSLSTSSGLKRTAASNTAYNTLISRGVTVNINIEE